MFPSSDHVLLNRFQSKMEKEDYEFSSFIKNKKGSRLDISESLPATLEYPPFPQW